jgi:sec-independent protein translocase protein TatC
MTPLDHSQTPEFSKEAPLLEHLIELRKRLIWAIIAFLLAFLLCFSISKQLFVMLVLPYKWAAFYAHIPADQVKLIYTAPAEFFFTQVTVAGFSALILSFPVIATQVYKFIAPGLYAHERNSFLPFLIASPLLFLFGGLLVYFFFAPMVMWFFLSMQQSGGGVEISLLPKVSEYLSLIMTLILSFGLVFQLPVVTSLMVRTGLLNAQILVDKRKYAIVIAFVVAAVITPPDVLSQIGLALPTILLYEISIIVARLIEKQRTKNITKQLDKMSQHSDKKSS